MSINTEDRELAYAKQGVLATRNWDCFQRLIRLALRSGGGRGDGDGETTGGRRPGRGPAMAVALLLALLLAGSWGTAPAQAKTRTLKTGPAIVIVAFGTTTEAHQTYDFFEAQLRREMSAEWRQAPIVWAYTSSIVRELVNKKFAAEGNPKRYLSVSQTLADLQDQGYRQVAVQSLHIFPGQEYDEMVREIQAFRGLGMRIEYGGSLLHRWDSLFASVKIVSANFLPQQDGCTIVVTHGTPETAASDNLTYLGLDRHVSTSYPGTRIGTVEGIIPSQEVLAWAKTCKPARVRLVPFMYVAGDHIMHDIMGEVPNREGEPSWAMELKAAGIKVDSVTTEEQGRKVFKGLGLYPEINHIFIEELINSLKRLQQ